MTNIDSEKLSHSLAYPLRHDNNFKDLDKYTGWVNLYALYEYINKPYNWDYFVSLIIIIINPLDVRTKVRYQLNTDGNSNNWKIRALQGHSIKSIIIDSRKLETNKNILLVHGTKKKYLQSIKQFGLKKIRNDIHFIPVGAPTMIQHFIDRKSDAYLYITTGVLIDNGFEVYKVSNNVYLVPNDIPYELLWELGTNPVDL